MRCGLVYIVCIGFLWPLKLCLKQWIDLNLSEWHLLGRQLGSIFILGFYFVSDWRSAKNKITWMLPCWKSLTGFGAEGLCDWYLVLFFIIWSYLLSNVAFLFWKYQMVFCICSLTLSFLTFLYDEAGKITHLYCFSHCFKCSEAQTSSEIALLYTWCGQIQEFLKLLILSLFLLLLCLWLYNLSKGALGIKMGGITQVIWRS